MVIPACSSTSRCTTMSSRAAACRAWPPTTVPTCRPGASRSRTTPSMRAPTPATCTAEHSAQCVAVHEPDDLTGADARTGEVLAGADPRDRAALLGAGDGDHHELGARDRREREG